MKYIILVLWTFSLFLLMFSSFPYRVECRPTPSPKGGCPVLENILNPWPDLYKIDITQKVWDTLILLEGTARSRSEVRADNTFGVTFDLHRVIKGDAPLLRRRKQFRLQFLDNPNSPERDRDFERRGVNNRNIKNNSTINLRVKSVNNLNNLYNSHSRQLQLYSQSRQLLPQQSRNVTRRRSRNVNGFGGRGGSTSGGSVKCLPPKATVKTGRKYYVFAAKVDNHFIAVFSPELANKRNTKAVEGVLCKGCGQAPSVVAVKDAQVKVKERLRLRCRLRAGNPIPLLTWQKDGRPLNFTDPRFRLRTKRRQSILVIRKAKDVDAGVYRCEGKNVFGSAHASVKVSVPVVPANMPPKNRGPPPPHTSSSRPVGTTPTTLWPLAASECPYDSYCLNGGTCSYYETIGEFVCQCSEGYKGQRCDTKEIANSGSMYNSYFCIFGTNNPNYPC